MTLADIICSITCGAFLLLGVLAHLEDERARQADALQEHTSTAEAPMIDELAEHDRDDPGAADGVPVADDNAPPASSLTRASTQHRHRHGTALLPSRNARRRNWH
jgi:hypothetical protein